MTADDGQVVGTIQRIFHDDTAGSPEISAGRYRSAAQTDRLRRHFDLTEAD